VSFNPSPLSLRFFLPRQRFLLAQQPFYFASRVRRGTGTSGSMRSLAFVQAGGQDEAEVRYHWVFTGRQT